jgi:hypothetical protein
MKTAKRSGPTDTDKTEKMAMAAIEEARMVLPGIQALFGFQLIAAFNATFRQLEPQEQILHFVALVLVAVAIAIIMTPAAYNNHGKLLREVLDRAVNNSRGLRFPALQQFVELLPAQFDADLIAERITARLPKRFAPLLDDFPEGALAGAVAQKTLVIFELDVVAVEINRRQAGSAVGGDGWQHRFLRHGASCG